MTTSRQKATGSAAERDVAARVGGIRKVTVLATWSYPTTTA